MYLVICSWLAKFQSTVWLVVVVGRRGVKWQQQSAMILLLFHYPRREGSHCKYDKKFNFCSSVRPSDRHLIIVYFMGGKSEINYFFFVNFVGNFKLVNIFFPHCFCRFGHTSLIFVCVFIIILYYFYSFVKLIIILFLLFVKSSLFFEFFQML